MIPLPRLKVTFMRFLTHALVLSLCLCALAEAADVPPVVLTVAASLLPDTEPDRVEPAPVAGFYQAIFGTRVVYLSADGRYLLYGDLIDINKNLNLTEDARRAGRRQVIEDLDEAGMVVFAPQNVESTITVFTDTSCGYCVKLHQEIAHTVAGGVKVRYVGFPRAGVNSASGETLVSVWCADNPQQAMTDAKMGIAIETKTCQTQIGRHMEAAELVGVRGTPTIVLEDGTVIPGYVPAGELVERSNRAAELVVD